MLVTTLLMLQRPRIGVPPVGAAIRAALVEAIRPYAYKSGAKSRGLTIDLISTNGTAAAVRCAPSDEDRATWSPRFDATGDLSTFFLRKSVGRWRLLGSLADFHEGGMISVYDLRGLRALQFPRPLLTVLPDKWPKSLAKGEFLFGFDEKYRPMPITPVEADRIARERNPKIRGRDAQIVRFLPA